MTNTSTQQCSYSTQYPVPPPSRKFGTSIVTNFNHNNNTGPEDTPSKQTQRSPHSNNNNSNKDNDDVSDDDDCSMFDSTVDDSFFANSTTINSEIQTPTLSHQSNPYLSPITPFDNLYSNNLKLDQHIGNFHDTTEILKGITSPLESNGSGSGSNSKYTSYKLKSESLNSFVIPKDSFHLKLESSIGNGSSSYVYEGRLESYNEFGTNSDSGNDNTLQVAVKIPKGKVNCKVIEREAEFILNLKRFQLQNGRVSSGFPFAQSYGLYYLNKSDFQLIRKLDELPCLLMEKLDFNLTQFIELQLSKGEQEDDGIAIGYSNWLSLFECLINSLLVLREMESVHCDFKSDNVMMNLTSSGSQFKIIDFSSANRLKDLVIQPEMTLQFTPPELIISPGQEKPPLPNYNTDLFSCGMILLHAVTGKAPYEQFQFSQFYLINLVREMKVIDVLEREDLNRLNNNSAVFKLIKMILVDRCTLDNVIDYYNTTLKSDKDS